MKIGLYDVDSHNFPNLALMKISAYHKNNGDTVQWATPLEHFDKVYVSKVFGDEYSDDVSEIFNADEVVYGGTGYAINVQNGKEVYRKENDSSLEDIIEHQYPDYSLYPELTQNKAYGFLTRGCPNDCSFCIVSKKEGRKSVKVADLSEFWNGQKHICLLDANILACKDRLNLLQQLADSGAYVDFTQGLDARFITQEVAEKLNQIKIEMVHFAFDFMKNEQKIIKGLKIAKDICGFSDRKAIVYMLTNYDTTLKEDLYRWQKIRECGFSPDVRIYRKHTAPKFLKDLQRFTNNRILYRSSELEDYVPRKDGKTMKELYRELFIDD